MYLSNADIRKRDFHLPLRTILRTFEQLLFHHYVDDPEIPHAE